jgi:Cu/Ag efflux protein CusF
MVLFRPLVFLIVIAALLAAQSQPPPRSQVSGTIAGIDTANHKLTLKSDKGDTLSVATTGHTLVLRIPPGETDARKGTKIALDTVTAGDRAVIVGAAGEASQWNASAVLVMTRADVTSVQQKEQEDWKRRGVTGIVTAVDPAAKTITIKSGSRSLTVKPATSTTWFRYSPDSARFADARSSSFDQVRAGDQLRVLGKRSDDAIDAEKIVFGSFRQIAATVKSIDPARNEITVKDLADKKPIVIRMEPDTTMKKLPPQMAQMLARRYAPGASATSPGGRGPGNSDTGGMLDRLPAMPLAELKPGDAIMISTTQGSEGKATGIMLLAGVEPLLTASPSSTRDIMSGWNLGEGGDTGQ